MKRAAIVAFAAVATLFVGVEIFAAPLSQSGILPNHLGIGAWIFQARSTTTNAKIVDAQNAAGTSKFSADIEGDVVAAGSVQGATVYSVGNLTVGSGVFSITAASGNLATSGTIAAGGAISGPRAIVSAASGSTTLTAAQSGALVANTGTSATTTFVLPAAAAGLNYCFVEAGDAAGELLVTPASGDVISMKLTIDGAQLKPAAGTGVKNAAGGNTISDHVCLVAIDATTWIQTAMSGTWASQ